MRQNVTEIVDYSRERLFTDAFFVESMARELCRVAVSVEKAAGAPQDIEGAICYAENDLEPTVYLVQSRAQIV